MKIMINTINYIPSSWLVLENKFSLIQKKLASIVLIAFGCLAVCYAVRRYFSFQVVPKYVVVPKHVSDSSANKIFKEVNTLSEQGSNRFGVYITANDFDFENSIQEMNISCPENGTHVGCAGWHNLDIMAIRQSSFGIIIDLNANNEKLMDLTSDVITQSRNREEFIEVMIQRLHSISIQLGEDILNRSLEQRVRDQLITRCSWLASQASFEYIQNLFKTGRIIAVTLDMRQEEKFKKLACIFKNNHLKVDTVYLCNTRYFIEGADQQKFANAINHIIEDNTFVIHCPDILPYQNERQDEFNIYLPIHDQKNSRRQCVIQGQEVKTHPAKYFIRSAKDLQDMNKVDP